MPLLATYTFAGAASLADSTNCFAHALPTTPDWALFTPITPWVYLSLRPWLAVRRMASISAASSPVTAPPSP